MLGFARETKKQLEPPGITAEIQAEDTKKFQTQRRNYNHTFRTLCSIYSTVENLLGLNNYYKHSNKKFGRTT